MTEEQSDHEMDEPYNRYKSADYRDSSKKQSTRCRLREESTPSHKKLEEDEQEESPENAESDVESVESYEVVVLKIPIPKRARTFHVSTKRCNLTINIEAKNGQT